MLQRISRVTPVLMLLLLVVIASLVPAPVAAQIEQEGDTPKGAISDGPTTLSFFFIPLVQASEVQSRDCPYPVGEGVLCTGPTIPEDYETEAGQKNDGSTIEEQITTSTLAGQQG